MTGVQAKNQPAFEASEKYHWRPGIRSRPFLRFLRVSMDATLNPADEQDERLARTRGCFPDSSVKNTISWGGGGPRYLWLLARRMHGGRTSGLIPKILSRRRTGLSLLDPPSSLQQAAHSAHSMMLPDAVG